MTPWSAINLVDYYWVRKERYNIAQLFLRDGEYGRFNKGAFLAYAIGVLIQIPFMNSSLYVGPIADLLGGAEIAWLIGLVVAGGLYYATSHNVRNQSTSALATPEPANVAAVPATITTSTEETL